MASRGHLSMGTLGYVLLAIVVVVIGLAISGLRVANEYERAVVFRLGRLTGTRGPGLYWLIPLGIEQQKKVDLRTKTIDMESQESITKDSVTVKVNAVVWLKINDPIKAVVNVADYYTASYQVGLTSLRNIIGQHVLDEVLKERDQLAYAAARPKDVAPGTEFNYSSGSSMLLSGVIEQATGMTPAEYAQEKPGDPVGAPKGPH